MFRPELKEDARFEFEFDNPPPPPPPAELLYKLPCLLWVRSEIFLIQLNIFQSQSPEVLPRLVGETLSNIGSVSSPMKMI